MAKMKAKLKNSGIENNGEAAGVAENGEISASGENNGGWRRKRISESCHQP
jgi:hypothetical protein